MGCTSSSAAGADSGGDLGATERVMQGRKGIDKTERIKTKSERQRLESKMKKLAQDQSATGGGLPEFPKLDENGHLTAEEVAKRISGSVETKEVVLGDVKSGSDDGLIHVRYAALTQRGFYPDNPKKENQDAYYICPSKFANGEGDALFTVFDGHGINGGECALYAKKKLPVLISQHVRKARTALNAQSIRESSKTRKGPLPKDSFHPSNWPYLAEDEYQKAFLNAHIQCNKAMNESNEVKDNMSGTTAVSVGFHAGRMTVANVGDSRAILGYRIQRGGPTSEEEKTEIEAIGSEEEKAKGDSNRTFSPGELIAIPLSEDQTPYRKDERERLKRAGARICSIDQMEGIAPMHEAWGEVDLGVDIDEEGDPPRVWCKDHDYPGNAFSRSLGDKIGEDIGIIPDPEFVTKNITKGDEILVIASDGIFEFLTNQRVIDICAECDDPLYACTKLLQASYEKWLQYELRTDDITCIVLFMKNSRPDDETTVRALRNKKLRVKSVSSARPREHSMTPLSASDADMLADVLGE